MNSPPLLALGVELVPIIVMIIGIVSWVMQQLSGPKVPLEPPVRRPGRPVRPRDERVQDEIDSFIREVSQKKPAAAEPRAAAEQRPAAPMSAEQSRQSGQRRRKKVERPALPPPPSEKGSDRPTRRSAPAESLGGGVRESVTDHIGQGAAGSVAQHHLDSRIDKGVNQHLGAFDVPAKAEVAQGTAARMRALFRNPTSVRQSILIQEILGPPKGRQVRPGSRNS